MRKAFWVTLLAIVLSVPGQLLPGTSANVTDNSTLTVDVGYDIILKNHDAAVSRLDVHNHAKGLLAEGVPVKAHVTLNPSLVSLGAKVPLL